MWQDVEAAMDAGLRTVPGGFSPAARGLVDIAGVPVFVKQGVDDSTRAWARKEVAVYRFLARHGFAAVAPLLAVSPDESGFALQALTEDDGWDWSDRWSAERLAATLAALDELAAIPAAGTSFAPLLTPADGGWERLTTAALEGVVPVDALPVTRRLIAAPPAFTFHDEHLVHLDVRADNCAWHPASRRVALVDWNWTAVGDRRIDLAAFLVTVHATGFDVRPTGRFDADALIWLAGFWLAQAVQPIWPGGPDHLRPAQRRYGLTALELAGVRRRS